MNDGLRFPLELCTLASIGCWASGAQRRRARTSSPGGSLGLFAGPDPEAGRILAIGDPLLGSTVAELASKALLAGAATLLLGAIFVALRAPGREESKANANAGQTAPALGAAQIV